MTTIVSELKCAVCDKCERHPKFPNYCVYGGPFIGYTDKDYKPLELPEKKDT